MIQIDKYRYISLFINGPLSCSAGEHSRMTPLMLSGLMWVPCFVCLCSVWPTMYFCVYVYMQYIHVLCIHSNGEYIFKITAGWTWGYCSSLASFKLPYAVQYIFPLFLGMDWSFILMSSLGLPDLIKWYTFSCFLECFELLLLIKKKIISGFVFTFLVLHVFDSCALKIVESE